MRKALLCAGIAIAVLLSGSPATAQDFKTRWRQRVAKFRGENARLKASDRPIVLFGSSSMEGWRHSNRVKRYLPTYHSRALNRGISGDGIGLSQTTGLYNRIKTSVTDAHPGYVFILNGRNSIGYGPTRVAARYQQVVAKIRRDSPNAVITIVTCPPVRGNYAHMKAKIVTLNRELARIAREEGTLFFDLHTPMKDSQGLLKSSLTNDGLHFKNEGYRILGQEIERIVRDGVRPPAPAPPSPPVKPTPTPTTPAPSTGRFEVTPKWLNLRLGPGLSEPRVGALRRGTVVEVLEHRGVWGRIKADSRRGWVHTDYLRAIASTPAPATEHEVTANWLNLRAGPSTSDQRLASLSKGTKLRILRRQGVWAEVITGSRRGWVHTDYVRPVASTGLSGSLPQ